MTYRVTPYDLVIFDFDGTLADSAPWFRSVFNDVARRYRFRQLSEEEMEALRGRPNREVVRYLGVPKWKLPFIARHMRRLMHENAHAIPLFEGVGALLEELASRNITIAIATSNFEPNVRQILGPDNTRHIAQYACGVPIFGKARVFRKITRKLGVPPNRVLAIGDEVRDIEAARKVGIAAGAVAWGFATPEILRAHQPDYFFNSMQEIASTVTKNAPTGEIAATLL